VNVAFSADAAVGVVTLSDGTTLTLANVTAAGLPQGFDIRRLRLAAAGGQATARGGDLLPNSCDRRPGRLSERR
jgi:hypothetical protein